MVEADSYFLELVRYIHLNPVRAGLISKPDGYAWSGHDVYLDRRQVSWLTTEWALSQWSKRIGTAQARYRQFVHEGMAEGRREDFHRGNQPGQLLGRDDFAKSLQRRGQKSRQSKISTQAILNSVMYVCDVSMHDLQSSRRVGGIASARAFAAYLVLESGEGTLTGLGELLNRDVSTLSNAASAVRIAVENDDMVRKTLNKIIKEAKLDDKTKRTKA